MKKRADNLNFNFKEKNKKAQVTIIIIIAIVLIAVIILFFVFKDEIKLATLTRNLPEITEIDRIMTDCINARSIEAVRLIGIQGGYITLPEEYLETQDFEIAYAVYNGKKTLISKKNMEKEIKSYIEMLMPYCIDPEKNSELKTEIKDIEVNIDINDNSVLASAKVFITAKKEETSFTIKEKYGTEVPIKLGSMHDVAKEIVDRVIKEPNYVDLNYLTGTDYDVLFVPYNNEIVIYSITDLNSQIDDIAYTFMFATKV